MLSREMVLAYKFVRSVILEKEMRLAALSSASTYLSNLLAFDEPVITSHDTLTVDLATGRSLPIHIARQTVQ